MAILSLEAIVLEDKGVSLARMHDEIIETELPSVHPLKTKTLQIYYPRVLYNILDPDDK